VTKHDPLCGVPDFVIVNDVGCDCAVIAAAATREREAIAEAIHGELTEVLADDYADGYADGLNRAAKIARNGGTL
jgi:hypothetical protein